MNAAEWSQAELIKLHELFLEMRQTAIMVVRLSRTWRLVALPASRARLRVACAAVCKCRAHQRSLRARTADEARLLLVERLSGERLNYADLGIDPFGSWYWTLCRRACRDAWKKLHSGTFPPLTFVDPDELGHVTAECPPRYASDWLTQVIGGIADDRLRIVILDWASGIRIGDSASRHGISSRTVNRLRRRGRRLLVRLCAGDFGDEN